MPYFSSNQIIRFPLSVLLWRENVPSQQAKEKGKNKEKIRKEMPAVLGLLADFLLRFGGGGTRWYAVWDLYFVLTNGMSIRSFQTLLIGQHSIPRLI